MPRSRELAELATSYDSGGSLGFRNRIINGDCRIDQRNNGASVTASANATYFLDRWRNIQNVNSKFSVQQNAGSVTPPVGFTNYLGTTSLSAYSLAAGELVGFGQIIEGLNVADLGWGTASAQTVTLSFRVYSSLTGTFAGSIQNGSQNRSYPFTFSIPSANTWTTITVNIPGDTTGTWLTNNGLGLMLWFSLGSGANWQAAAGSWGAGEKYGVSGQVSVVGTNGATFYITGVQLEAGSVATPFERRDYGRELMMCQRYYYRQTPTGTAYYGVGFNDSTTVASLFINFPVSLRAAPSSVEQSGTASHYRVQYTGNVTNCSAVPQLNFADVWGAMVLFTVASGLTAGQASIGRSNSTSGYLGFSAEL